MKKMSKYKHRVPRTKSLGAGINGGDVGAGLKGSLGELVS